MIADKWCGMMHKIVCVVVLLLAGATAHAQSQPTDLKVLEERKDAAGNVIRTIQYYQNGKRIVETRTFLPPPQLDKPINPDTLNKDDLMVVINKSRLQLDVYYKRVRIRSCKAVFGPKPQLDKKMKGDRCTPEGWFRISEKHVSARYNKFLKLDYPNDSSWAKFATLKAKGQIPQTAEIGGDVGIHGVWKGGDDMIEMGVGWTDGCIAVKNKDVDELYRLLEPGVRVLVRK
jgi:murein L,D-transpeptidase YafK